MRVICCGQDLAKAFAKVVRAISNNANIEILECVKIETNIDSITLTAMDNEITIISTIEAKVIENGIAVVPCKFIYELVKKMSSEQIELDSTNGKSLIVKCLDSKTKINLSNAKSYPQTEIDKLEYKFSLKQSKLKDMIQKTIVCAATDNSRPILQSVLFNVTNNKLQLVAIDGLRLARTIYCFEADNQSFNIVVPARVLNELSKMLIDSDKDVVVTFNQYKVKFSLEDTIIISRLIRGDYINYSKIIPNAIQTSIQVDTKSLKDTLDRVCIISKNAQANMVKINVCNNSMQIESSSNLGTIKDIVPVKQDGKDITIALNSKMFSECLKAVDDNFIAINFNAETQPITITPIGNSEEYLYLILPIRVL